MSQEAPITSRLEILYLCSVYLCSVYLCSVYMLNTIGHDGCSILLPSARSSPKLRMQLVWSHCRDCQSVLLVLCWHTTRSLHPLCDETGVLVSIAQFTFFALSQNCPNAVFPISRRIHSKTFQLIVFPLFCTRLRLFSISDSLLIVSD